LISTIRETTAGGEQGGLPSRIVYNGVHAKEEWRVEV
jgi:hypothetical protein